MSSGTFYPAAGDDDGQAGYGFNRAAGYFSIGRAGVGVQHVFVRFPNVTIPPGATINSAKLVFATYAGRSGWVHSNVRAAAADDVAATPTNNGEFNALTLTAAVVTWNFNSSAWSTAGERHDSPDLSAVMQEIVDRAGWRSGNAIMMIWKDSGSARHDYAMLRSFDFNGGELKPELHVTWTPFQANPSMATWNPLDRGDDIVVPKNNLLIASRGDSVAHSGIRSNFNKTTGLWYFEILITAGDRHFVGVATSSAALNRYAGGDAYGWAYCSDGTKRHDDNPFQFGDTYGVGDVVGVALDASAGAIWFSKNGVWQGSGSPVNSGNAAFAGLPPTLYAIWSSYFTG